MEIKDEVLMFCNTFEPYDTVKVAFAENDVETYHIKELYVDDGTENVVAMRLTKFKNKIDDWIVTKDFYLKNIDMFKKIENG